MPFLGGRLHIRRRAMVSLARGGLLAAYAAAVYVSLTDGLGRALGAGDSRRSGLSLAAAALIAVGFAPARRLASRVVARTPLGRAGEGYEALTALAGTTASARTTGEAIRELATLLGRGTGAASASVWLSVRGSVVRAAVWPQPGETQEPPREPGIGAIAARDDVDHVAPVQDAGGSLGALAISKKPGDSITPPDEKLAADLASGAAPLLRTVALTAELAERVREAAQQEAELQASRRRLADAGAAERRQLAEEIRASFSRRLDGISEESARLRGLIASDRDAAARMMSALDAELTAIIDELRAFARGIHPSVLRDHGLAAAIESLQDAMPPNVPAPVRAEVHGVGRYRPTIETAVYFCTLQMIRTCGAHAGTGPLRVRLTDDGDELAVTVTAGAATTVPAREEIDTAGDRLAVLGGSADFVLSEDGHLTLRAAVPVGDGDRRGAGGSTEAAGQAA